MSSIKRSIKIFVYLIYTSLSVILLTEFIGFFVFDNRYNWDLRYLYYSKNPIVNEFSTSKAFWKYQPNSKIRIVAVYQGLLTQTIEYDCAFDTNKFGFIDTGEISKSVDFLVLGDSYTEGHGGCPWLIEDTILEDEHLAEFKILNGGLQGSGILKFEQVLEYFSSKVTIENLIIIAISNDFKRGDAYAWNIEGECYLNGSCIDKNDYWYYLQNDISRPEIKNTSRQRHKERDIPRKELWLRASFTYQVFSEYRTVLDNILSNSSLIETELDVAVYQENFEALDRIKYRFPKLKVILVPQRDEVGVLGVKNLDSLAVERYLEENMYQFSWCELTSRDYMPADGHPNGLGYKKLFKCLKENIL